MDAAQIGKEIAPLIGQVIDQYQQYIDAGLTPKQAQTAIVGVYEGQSLEDITAMTTGYLLMNKYCDLKETDPKQDAAVRSRRIRGRRR